MSIVTFFYRHTLTRQPGTLNIQHTHQWKLKDIRPLFLHLLLSPRNTHRNTANRRLVCQCQSIVISRLFGWVWCWGNRLTEICSNRKTLFYLGLQVSSWYTGSITGHTCISGWSMQTTVTVFLFYFGFCLFAKTKMWSIGKLKIAKIHYKFTRII